LCITISPFAPTVPAHRMCSEMGNLQEKQTFRDSLRNWRKSLKASADKNRERDRGFDKYAGRLSRFLWPPGENWLLAVVFSLCMLDFVTTYAALELGRNKNVYEAGPLAGWALGTGGFGFLFLVDLVSACILSLIAFAARYLYSRYGFKGYARAAFVIALAAYVVRTGFVVVNNLLVGFA
jgi:hypothetical protein